MEQFNPGLRNLVNLGKNYEKSVTGEYLESRCPLTHYNVSNVTLTGY